MALLSKVLIAAILFMSFAFRAHADSDNYEYGIFVVRSVAPELNAQMTIDQILTADTANGRVKDAITKSVAESQSSLLRSLFVEKSLVGVNLQTELAKSLKQFSDRLKVNLDQAQITRTMDFQIHVAPMISRILAERRAGNQVTARILYPTDRVSLVENMPDAGDIHADDQSIVLNDIYQGMASRLNGEYLKGGAEPFFVSLVINLKVNPAPQDSMWIAQAVVGLPVNSSLPFEQSNDQISFKRIEFPAFDKSNLGLTTDGMPTALLTIEQPLASSTGKMLIEFGPIGTFKDGKWIRPKDIANYSKLTPRLVGTPTGIARNKVDVVFNILNLAADLENQGVSSLDLFLSVGLPNFPGTRLGFINKPDIDQQFQTEINKAIQAAIQEQQKTLKSQGLAKVEALSSISPAMLEQIVSKLLTTKQQGN